MISSNIEYKNRLDNYLIIGRLPIIVSLTDPPADTIDVVTYNKWCMKTYIERLYNQKDNAPILVLQVEDLKSRFFEKYYVAADREELIMAEKKGVRDDIRNITGNQWKYAANLYKLIKSGREEMLFTINFFNSSHKAFKHYALIYDLVKFKVFLDEQSENLEAGYTDIRFILNTTQIERLYKSLLGIYICGDTKLNDFQAVFNLHKIEKTNRIKWVHMSSRNKNQLNKSTLFQLVLSLNEEDSYTGSGKQLKREVYRFIQTSFEDEQTKDLPKLIDAHRNYVKLNEGNSVKMIKELVAGIRALKK